MLFEDNKLYTLVRFLVIMFGTTGMTFGIVKFEKDFKKKIIILCAFMPYAIIVTLIPIYLSGWDLVIKIFFSPYLFRRWSSCFFSQASRCPVLSLPV